MIFMNHTAVIFTSKYGATKRYAQWIAQALSCPILEGKDCSKENLAKYDTIIYGGGLYAGGINGIKLLSQNWQLISEKHVILFTCGIADPQDAENVSQIRRSLAKTLPAEMMEKLHIFHFRGALDYARLGLVHRAMMAMLRKMLLKKDENELREEDKQLLQSYGKKVDFTDPDSISPLVELVRTLV